MGYLVCNQDGDLRVFVNSPVKDFPRGVWRASNQDENEHGATISRSVLATNLQDISWLDGPFNLDNWNVGRIEISDHVR